MTKAKENADSVGEGIVAENASWTFGGSTPEKFTSHVRRSVPLYEEGHDLVCKLSDFFVQEGSQCYELGVSTGALMAKLARRHANKKGVSWIGLDSVEAMIEQAKKEIGPDLPQVQLSVEDITLYPYQKADLVVSYYTIQFVPPYLRQELFNKIYEALNWGGAFLLFEKVRAPDARFQDYMTALYTDYKLEQGYSPEEIIAKSRSLKRVLEPFSTHGNQELLERAGFVDYMTVMKYVSFEGFLAIK